MPRFGRFEASVLVNGTALPEYIEEGGGGSTRPEGGPKHSVFVESKSGQEFVIRVKTTEATEYNQIEAALYIDGKSVRGVLLKNSTSYDFDGALSKDGASVQPFLFSNIKLVSNADMDEKSAAALLEEQKKKGVEGGQMRLEFWSYRVLGTVEKASFDDSFGQVKIHEQAKKGAFLSHTTSFGKAKAIKPTGFISGQRIGSAPLMTFVFEYRSRALLEAQGFTLPPDPEAQALALPPPAPAPAPAVSTGPKVKREKENSDGGVRVKNEGEAQPPPVKKLQRLESGRDPERGLDRG